MIIFYNHVSFIKTLECVKLCTWYVKFLLLMFLMQIFTFIKIKLNMTSCMKVNVISEMKLINYISQQEKNRNVLVRERKL